MAAGTKLWYALRVASNKEEQVRDTLVQKVKIEGLEPLVGRILVPTESITRPLKGKTGGRRIYERKLYPGYVFVEMEMNADGTVPDQAWFVFKETAGVGDFIGSGGDKDKAGKPTPMGPDEVSKMLAVVENKGQSATVIQTEFKKGQHVKIKEGPFENFEGEVAEVVAAKGMVKVMVTIFGRKTELDVEYYQLEPV